jgi:hypothetical protein
MTTRNVLDATTRRLNVGPVALFAMANLFIRMTTPLCLGAHFSAVLLRQTVIFLSIEGRRHAHLVDDIFDAMVKRKMRLNSGFERGMELLLMSDLKRRGKGCPRPQCLAKTEAQRGKRKL